MDLDYAQRNRTQNAAVLGRLNHVPDDFELFEGTPRLGGWPSDASFKLDPDYGIKLDDVLECLNSLLVVSDRLRDFLDAQGVPLVEMLPVTVIDLKGRPIEAPYFIVHPVDLPDALNLEASGVEFNEIVPEDIDEVERLVVREESIEPDRVVFRLARYSRPILFERGVAERVLAKGFTGIGFAPIEEFDPFTLL